MSKDVIEKLMADHCPLGRCALPEDVARVVAFLASGDGGWVNGTCYALVRRLFLYTLVQSLTLLDRYRPSYHHLRWFITIGGLCTFVPFYTGLREYNARPELLPAARLRCSFLQSSLLPLISYLPDFSVWLAFTLYSGGLQPHHLSHPPYQISAYPLPRPYLRTPAI